MADFTRSGVSTPGPTAVIDRSLFAGEPISDGHPCYLGTDGLAYKATASDLDKYRVYGIAVNTATATGQPISLCRSDDAFTPDFAFDASVDKAMVLSNSAALGTRVAPVADFVAGLWPNFCLLMTPNDDTTVRINITQFSYSDSLV